MKSSTFLIAEISTTVQECDATKAQQDFNCLATKKDLYKITVVKIQEQNDCYLDLPPSYRSYLRVMAIRIEELLTVTFTLFAIIDIIGSIPILISLKTKMGGIREGRATMIAGLLMVLFLYMGAPFLHLLGLDVRSFAVGGSIVIFILGLEMVLGAEFFKSEKDVRAATVVPIAFPLIAGSGTLTTIISLKANYTDTTILIAILANLLIVYLVLKSLKLIERILGPAGLIAVRKFFGVVLLAIAVKIFASNAPGLFK